MHKMVRISSSTRKQFYIYITYNNGHYQPCNIKLLLSYFWVHRVVVVVKIFSDNSWEMWWGFNFDQGYVICRLNHREVWAHIYEIDSNTHHIYPVTVFIFTLSLNKLY